MSGNQRILCAGDESHRLVDIPECMTILLPSACFIRHDMTEQKAVS
jgi:hypothetical protein